MAIHTDYYGVQHGVTCLEFYEKNDAGERLTHTLLTDQDAYDTWHLSLIFKEVIAHRCFADTPTGQLDDVLRKEKHLLMYLLFASDPAIRSVLELGCAMFEMIDGMNAVARWADQAGSPIPRPDLKSIAYRGIDIAPDMRNAARVLHPGYDVQVASSVPTFTEQVDLLYERNVSSDVFTEVSELVAFIKHSRIALMNLFVTSEQTFISSRFGKSLTYFSLPQLIETLDRPLFHLFGDRSPGHDTTQGKPVIEGFFLAAPQDAAERFVAVAESDPQIKAYFQDKQIRLTPASDMIAQMTST